DDIKGVYLGAVYQFHLYIIENFCGDFDFRDLVVTKNGNLISKLLIDTEYWDIEEKELHNEADETKVTFEITKDYIITVKTVISLEGQIQTSKIKKYRINNKGYFIEIKT